MYTFLPTDTDNDIPRFNEDENEYRVGMILNEECVKVTQTFKNVKM